MVHPHKKYWSIVPEPRKFLRPQKITVQDIRKFNPDFIIIHAHCSMDRGVRNTLSKYKSFYIFTDYRRTLPHYVKDYARSCTAIGVVHKDKSIWQDIKIDCKQKNIFFIDVGANTDIYKPIKCKKKYDILFAASGYGGFPASKKRIELITKLKNHFGNRFHLIGKGWRKEFDAMSYQPPPKLNETINQTKVTVGMSNFLDVPYYTSARLFQHMATGVPHIAWHTPGVKNLFNDGYLEVSNYNDLFFMIKTLLSDQKIRKNVGKRQFLEIKNYHTASHLFNYMKKILENINP